MNNDRRINQLNPGQSIRISGNSKCWVVVERSGNGSMLRWVRCTENSFEVFHSCKF